MKKVLVIGSNGKEGSLIVNELVSRGYDVTGLGQSENKTNVKKYIQKNVFDLTKEEVVKYNVVVDALGAWTIDTIPNIGNAIIYLGQLLSGSNTRLIVVGGAGSLFVNDEQTVTVDMGPDFPDDWKPLSSSHGKGLTFLKQTTDLNWTNISPACNFVSDGARTGSYKLGFENLILNSKGESTISYADYAIALVDEIDNNKYNKQRISVVSK